jgi:preprotein translocase subunit SecD
MLFFQHHDEEEQVAMVTAANVGRKMPVVDGADRVLTSPRIESAITGGRARITVPSYVTSRAELQELADAFKGAGPR